MAVAFPLFLQYKQRACRLAEQIVNARCYSLSRSLLFSRPFYDLRVHTTQTDTDPDLRRIQRRIGRDDRVHVLDGGSESVRAAIRTRTLIFYDMSKTLSAVGNEGCSLLRCRAIGSRRSADSSSSSARSTRHCETPSISCE